MNYQAYPGEETPGFDRGAKALWTGYVVRDRLDSRTSFQGNPGDSSRNLDPEVKTETIDEKGGVPGGVTTLLGGHRT